MSFSIFLSFVIYTIVTSITPGPNNLMVATSGVNFGLRATYGHILGVAIGFGVMVILVGLGIGTLLSQNQLVYEILKLIGIAYLIYLAIKIAQSGSVELDKTQAKPITFLQAALFQWVNPKAWIMAMGAVTTYLAAGSEFYWYIILGVVFGLVCIPCTGAWGILGEKLQTLVRTPQHLKIFNYSMAILLVASIIKPMIDSFKYFQQSFF